MADAIIETIRQQLHQFADESTRLSGQRFFKEAIQLYGVKSAMVGKISKASFGLLREADKSAIYRLGEQLWQSGMLEESFVICHWSYYLKNQYDATDFAVFEYWVNSYINNWASCDTLCNHSVGSCIEAFPELMGNLKAWTSSENRWVRRASAVSLIVPARKGLFLTDIFEIAERLLTDGDDMVQKGYGWMLKAASQAHQSEVFDFVIQHKTHMPRTALRYAIEKMPATLKAEAMKK